VWRVPCRESSDWLVRRHRVVAPQSDPAIAATRLKSTYRDLAGIDTPGSFGGLKVKAVRGSSALTIRDLSCGLAVKGPAIIPSPVSTSDCPLDPALEPSSGISFLAWKFRGLRPRTTMGDVVASASTVLVPLLSVPTTLRCSKKCCCSSFLRPLFAVALCRRLVLRCQDSRGHLQLTF
jgi:hypothetical protein